MVNLTSFWKMRHFRWFSNTVEKLLTWRCCPGGFSFLDFLSRSISHFHSTAAFSGRPTWSSEKLRILLHALKNRVPMIATKKAMHYFFPYTWTWEWLNTAISPAWNQWQYRLSPTCRRTWLLMQTLQLVKPWNLSSKRAAAASVRW